MIKWFMLLHIHVLAWLFFGRLKHSREYPHVKHGPTFEETALIQVARTHAA